jgi:hypothetical protein
MLVRGAKRISSSRVVEREKESKEENREENREGTSMLYGEYGAWWV